MEALIAIAIIVLIIIIAWIFWPKGPPAGVTPAGAVPTSVIDQWTTAPTEVIVGTPATFVFESQNNNPASMGAQLTPISGRGIGFTSVPGVVKIVSIGTAAMNSNTGAGTTGTDGKITVVIQVDSLPAVEQGQELPRGSLIGIPAAATTVQKRADFTIRE